MPGVTGFAQGRCAAAQPWLKRVVDKLPEDEQAAFKEKSQGAMKFLLGKIKELQLYGPASVLALRGCSRASLC